MMNLKKMGRRRMKGEYSRSSYLVLFELFIPNLDDIGKK
jgi:hypothetical protein